MKSLGAVSQKAPAFSCFSV